MSTKSSSSSGVSFLSLLGLLFIGLKLTGFIDWSWWWVLAPFWVGVSFVFLVLVLFAVANSFKR
jgi:hypothetical protein